MINLTNIDKIKLLLTENITIDPKYAARFFKISEGEYGYFDKFLGITAPNLRKIAKKYNHISFDDLLILISSEYNEVRALALIILVDKYNKSKSEREKIDIYNFYIQHIKYVNNWNLVDISAHKILGAHIYYNKPKDLLHDLSKSENLWYRRIAVISCWYFIKKRNYSDFLKIASILINDKEDLIHKAVGWMLREMGKLDKDILIDFLDKNHLNMPRVMVRYSIEKFENIEKKKYLKKLN